MNAQMHERVPLDFSLRALCDLCGWFSRPARAADEGRTKTRLLYDFEDASDVKRLLKGAENVTLTTVEDVGVTHGSKCARLTAAKGAEYAVMQLDAEAIKDWGDFDYFAIDVTHGRRPPLPTGRWSCGTAPARTTPRAAPLKT